MKKITKILLVFCSCFLFICFFSPKAKKSVFALQQITNESEETKETDTVPSRNYTVVIDPGHGGLDVK